MTTPERAFGDLLAASGAQPFVTYYDESTGERTELSVRSLANWVAKTHFLLTEELGLGVGSRAYLDLPAHWISVPAVLGCLAAGLALTSDPSAADVAFAAGPAPEGVLDAYAIDPAHAAVGWGATPPAGTSDYVAAVRPQADAWASVRMPAGPSDECVDGRSRAEIVAANTLPSGARLLSTRGWATLDDIVDTLIAPVIAGGSVVYVRNASPDVVERRMAQERATVLLT